MQCKALVIFVEFFFFLRMKISDLYKSVKRSTSTVYDQFKIILILFLSPKFFLTLKKTLLLFFAANYFENMQNLHFYFFLLVFFPKIIFLNFRYSLKKKLYLLLCFFFVVKTEKNLIGKKRGRIHACYVEFFNTFFSHCLNALYAITNLQKQNICLLSPLVFFNITSINVLFAYSLSISLSLALFIIFFCKICTQPHIFLVFDLI